MRFAHRIWIGLALAGVLTAQVLAGEATVGKGELLITFERHARVEPARRHPVRYEPDVFGGRLEIAARPRGPGPVSAGDVLVELVAKDFDEQYDDARTLAAESERRLQIQQQEKRIALEQAQVAVERAEFTADVAQRANELFRSYESVKAVEHREIGLQSQRDGQKDERTELEQLEKMYKGTTLADETKDIVLERARRGVARTERYAKYWEPDYKYWREIALPQDMRRHADGAKYSAFDLENARIGARLAAVRSELDLAAAERGVRDAQRRAERLGRDREKLVMKAPCAGYWTPQVREAGEQVQAWQAVGEVVELAPLRLKGTLDPAAFRIIQRQPDGTYAGALAHLRFPARPEITASAKFTEVSSVGTPEGDSTAFPFLAAIECDANDVNEILVGFDAIVYGKKTLSDVLLVPDKAIGGGPARPVVKRRNADGKEEEVNVRLGPSAGGRTVIVEGLNAGDKVVTPDG